MTEASCARRPPSIAEDVRNQIGRLERPAVLLMDAQVERDVARQVGEMALARDEHLAAVAIERCEVLREKDGSRRFDLTSR